MHGVEPGSGITYGGDVPQLDVLAPDTGQEREATSYEVVVDYCAVAWRVGVPDPSAPEVARKTDDRLELLGLDVLDQLARRVQLPVVGYAEYRQERIVRRKREIRSLTSRDAVLVVLRTGNRLQHALEVVSIFGRLVHLNAGLLQQIRSVHHDRPDRRPSDRDGVDLVFDHTRTPGIGRVVRQVRIVLDRVAAQVRRQILALGLDECRQA